MADFQSAIIEVRYATSAWGPYKFDFENLLEDNMTITSITPRAFEGILKPSDSITNFTEITSTLINSSSLSGNELSLYLNYVAASKGEKVTLIFEVTESSGGVHPFYFYYVVIK